MGVSVSQFTLYGILKGNKPDFHVAMPPQKAKPFYASLVDRFRTSYNPDAIKGMPLCRLLYFIINLIHQWIVGGAASVGCAVNKKKIAQWWFCSERGLWMCIKVIINLSVKISLVNDFAFEVRSLAIFEQLSIMNLSCRVCAFYLQVWFDIFHNQIAFRVSQG